MWKNGFFHVLLCRDIVLLTRKNKKMATIVLEYNVRNAVAKKTLDYILSLGVFKEKRKKTGIEMAFEDIEKGQVTFINGPKKYQ